MKLKAYLQEVTSEIRKVEWPSRQQTMRMTAVVVGASVMVAGFIALSDAGLSQLMSRIFALKI